MTELCKIAEKHGTDKFGVYTPLYDLLLRNREVHRVLEIGIGTVTTMQHVPDYHPGASLRMWKDYFPNAIIFGLDINSEAVELAREDRIETHLVNGAHAVQLADFAQKHGGFDLIIDDGSHNPQHQQIAAIALKPFLNQGGLYIIEDAWHPEEVKLPWGSSVVETNYGSKKGRLILFEK